MKDVIFTILILTLSFFLGSAFSQSSTSLKFDDTNADSYVDCGTNDAYNLTSFTLEAWVNVSKFTETGDYIMANEGWTSEQGNQGFSFRFNGEHKPELSMGTGDAWPSVTSQNVVALNNWTHIAVSFDGTNLLIYINGQQDGSSSASAAMIYSNQNLILGEGAMWRDRRFNGLMKDVRIWNVVRTAQEISDGMNNFLNGDEAGLVANWKMNEGSGSILADATGDHSASIGSGVTWNTTVDIGDGLFTAQEVLSVYPNPASDFVSLRNNGQDVASIKIIDVIGKTVNALKVQGGDIKTINISRLKRGIYFIIVQNSSGISTQKFSVL